MACVRRRWAKAQAATSTAGQRSLRKQPVCQSHRKCDEVVPRAGDSRGDGCVSAPGLASSRRPGQMLSFSLTVETKHVPSAPPPVAVASSALKYQDSLGGG